MNTSNVVTAIHSIAPAVGKVAHHGDPSGENLLIHGENLDAMQWMRPRFAGAFACAYVDPPFNTGRRFPEYDDARTPAVWSAMMGERLLAIRPLLREDGAIFVEVGDTMLGELLRLMDDVFGRENRVSTITVVRSAATGHKAKNRGPVNVTEFLLVYEKTRGAWRPRPQRCARDDFDVAYSTWLENPDEPCEAWRFRPHREHHARELGFPSAAKATRALGKLEMDRRVADHALHHPGHVVRFAQPRFEAVSREAQEIIRASRSQPERVLRLGRMGHFDMFFRGGNRILFLAHKVEVVDGEPRIVEPLTNVWDDLAFQGIAGEGGVIFERNKKPERLVERVLAMSTERGDWVLDPFLGSGTTAAVAHKMGRRWVGVEQGDHANVLCVPRLRRVVEGTDDTGISHASGWLGGGGFGVYAQKADRAKRARTGVAEMLRPHSLYGCPPDCNDPECQADEAVDRFKARRAHARDEERSLAKYDRG